MEPTEARKKQWKMPVPGEGVEENYAAAEEYLFVSLLGANGSKLVDYELGGC